MFSLNLFPRESGKLAAESESLPKQPADKSSGGNVPKSIISAHKGKLAVGAAAMFGIAIFYRWREYRLAKDDPEQYAQLKRLKAAVAAGIAQPDPQTTNKDGDTP